jgi:hypothetical protein
VRQFRSLAVRARPARGAHCRDGGFIQGVAIESAASDMSSTAEVNRPQSTARWENDCPH